MHTAPDYEPYLRTLDTVSSTCEARPQLSHYGTKYGYCVVHWKYTIVILLNTVIVSMIPFCLYYLSISACYASKRMAPCKPPWHLGSHGHTTPIFGLLSDFKLIYTNFSKTSTAPPLFFFGFRLLTTFWIRYVNFRKTYILWKTSIFRKKAFLFLNKVKAAAVFNHFLWKNEYRSPPFLLQIRIPN